MATNTFVELQTQNIANNTTAYVDFTSIPQTYTDLVIVSNITNFGGAGDYIYAQFGNGSIDTGANYSTTVIGGNGSTAAGIRWANRNNINIDYYAQPSTTEPSNRILEILNYSNTTTFKTILNKSGRAGAGVDRAGGVWHNTAAINTIRITTNSNFFASGSSFTLYGIKAYADNEVGTRASGGFITQDATHIYHAFPYSGTFAPSTTLSCDYLVVAGGGGGGQVASGFNVGGGGGGAGGLRTFTGVSFVGGTSYTVTVGAGGTGTKGSSSNGGSGTTSSIVGGAISSSSTGGGGGAGAGSGSVSNGGSGGGGAANTGSNAGSGNAGGYTPSEGNSGGRGYSGDPTFVGGGGGGAGTSGSAGTFGAPYTGGTGGDGATSSLIASMAIATGRGVNNYFAGGGGGGTYAGSIASTPGLGGGGIGGGGSVNAKSGASGTGSGGGGDSGIVAGAGSGGSGIVIIRYAK